MWDKLSPKRGDQPLSVPFPIEEREHQIDSYDGMAFRLVLS